MVPKKVVVLFLVVLLAGSPENCWTGSGDGFCGPNGKCDSSDGCVAHDDSICCEESFNM